jgi:hypothetical protein
MRTRRSFASVAVSSSLRRRRRVLMDHAPVFLPQKIVQDTSRDLSRFGDEVISKKVLNWTSDAEKNVPYVRGSTSLSHPWLIVETSLIVCQQARGEMRLVEERMSWSQVKAGETSRRWG